MNLINICKLTIIIFIVIFSSQTKALTDVSASEVSVNKSCKNIDDTDIDNCFTTMAELFNWMTNVRTPEIDKASPLSIIIGAGNFSSFNCFNHSNISIRGSGRDVSFITGAPAILSSNCNDISFENLSIVGTGSVGINWRNGNSHWSNVNVTSTGYTWLDDSCQAAQPSQHYWFGSRISATPKFGFSIAYVSYCDESWFIGSELSTVVNKSTSRASALEVTAQGIVHAYGSVLRSISSTGVTLPVASTATSNYGLVSVYSYSGGQAHIHATAIDVISEENNDVAALVAGDGGSIHANQSSYNMKSGGKVSRIIKGVASTVKAPYLWEAEILNKSLQTVNGADMSVEMVCVNGVNCQPHLMIYSSSCNINGPWLDSTANECRQ